MNDSEKNENVVIVTRMRRTNRSAHARRKPDTSRRSPRSGCAVDSAARVGTGVIVIRVLAAGAAVGQTERPANAGDPGGGLVGSPFEFFGLKGLFGTEGVDNGFAATSLVFTIPSMAFVAFQAVFAIITVALISGAIADRAKFGPWMVFAGIWATVVYFPVAHWVFAFDGAESETGGWIANNLLAIDFAGGTAVHINAGAAGLALAIVLGRRKNWPKEAPRPHSVPFVLLGASLLWFGWYGFNVGSLVFVANDGGKKDIAQFMSETGVTFMNTTVATSYNVLSHPYSSTMRTSHDSESSCAEARKVDQRTVASDRRCSASAGRSRRTRRQGKT